MGILSDYQTARTAVPLNGKDVMLRGLNLDDFAVLLQTHLEPITKVVEDYQRHKDSVFTQSNLQSFLLGAAQQFPGLVSEVISIAADEPEARSVKLPVGFQMSAISAISKLTLEEAGGLGNLFASLAALGKGVLQNASEMSQKQTRSRGSIGD